MLFRSARASRSMPAAGGGPMVTTTTLQPVASFIFRAASRAFMSSGFVMVCIFANIKRDFVKEIWIGPKSEVELWDIMCVLWRYGYYDEVDDYNEKHPILITKSSSSYR